MSAETNSVIQQDPLLADLDGGNYRILDGSPAQGAGRDVPGDEVADFDRANFREPPSIGAFEVP